MIIARKAQEVRHRFGGGSTEQEHIHAAEPAVGAGGGRVVLLVQECAGNADDEKTRNAAPGRHHSSSSLPLQLRLREVVCAGIIFVGVNHYCLLNTTSILI